MLAGNTGERECGRGKGEAEGRRALGIGVRVRGGVDHQDEAGDGTACMPGDGVISYSTIVVGTG